MPNYRIAPCDPSCPVWEQEGMEVKVPNAKGWQTDIFSYENSQIPTSDEFYADDMPLVDACKARQNSGLCRFVLEEALDA